MRTVSSQCRLRCCALITSVSNDLFNSFSDRLRFVVRHVSHPFLHLWSKRPHWRADYVRPGCQILDNFKCKNIPWSCAEIMRIDPDFSRGKKKRVLTPIEQSIEDYSAAISRHAA